MEEKCVMIVREGLPAGVAANTAAILGATLGKRMPETVGPDAPDRDGEGHPGIIQIPIPILQATEEALGELRERLRQPENQELFAVDFSRLAQSCRTYEEFLVRMSGTPAKELRYLGIAICGPKRPVERLTGSLPLYR